MCKMKRCEGDDNNCIMKKPRQPFTNYKANSLCPQTGAASVQVQAAHMSSLPCKFGQRVSA